MEMNVLASKNLDSILTYESTESLSLLINQNSKMIDFHLKELQELNEKMSRNK
jgi:hypothetical protein